MKTASLKFLLGLLLVLLGTTQLKAYFFLTDQWSAQKAAGGIVLHLQLDMQPGKPPIAGGVLEDGATSWNQVAEDAITMWNSHMDGKRFKFVAVRDSTIPIKANDGKNSVFWSNSIFGQAFGANTLAVATRWKKGGYRSEADVIFNNSKNWGSQRRFHENSQAFDLRRVALHEFGHVLGLDHPDEYGQEVYALMDSTIRSFALTPDDIVGAQVLWGLPSSVPVWRGWGVGSLICNGSAVDSAGNVYFADEYQHRILKVTPESVVSTFAGVAGRYGYHVDGPSDVAKFIGPMDVAVDASDNVYVADGPAIRKITPEGVVSTIATGLGSISSLTLDEQNNIYIVVGTGTVRKVVPNGDVTTLLTFNYYLSDIAVDSGGTMYVVCNVSSYHNGLYKVTPEGVMIRLAGGNYYANTSTDGKGPTASFMRPQSVAVDADGNVFVADDDALRKVTPDGVVTFVGKGGDYGTSVPMGCNPGGTSLEIGPDNVLYVMSYSGYVAAGTGFLGGGGAPDLKKPTLSVASAPGGSVSAPLPFIVSGTAVDNIRVTRVTVTLNDEEPFSATLEASSTPTAVTFSAEMWPQIGTNTLVVTAVDAAGNSTSITRAFTFEERYALTLARNVPVNQIATPDKAGTLSLSGTLTKNASALTKGPAPQTSNVLPGTQVKVTATAKTGHLFSHWEGLPFWSVVDGNVITFFMPEEEVAGLTAVFIANPFMLPELMPGVPNPLQALGSKPLFQGLLLPDIGTPAGNHAMGQITATLVAAKGSLSGKVLLDGKTTSFTGILHGDGSVWFKLGKSLRSSLPLLNGSVEGKTLSMSWSATGLQTVVNQPGGESGGLAKPKLAEAPVALLNTAKNTKGYLTLIMPSKEQSPSIVASAFPQGSGYARLTLTKSGRLTLIGVLADGTKLTASSLLVAGEESPVFVPLITPGAKASIKGGSFGGELVFDTTGADSDVSGVDWWWFRPAAVTVASKVQAYRSGWPEGITLDPVGALYDAKVPVQDTLGLGSVDILAGNAELLFADGKLTADVPVTGFNIDGNKVVKLHTTDASFTLSAAANTGLIKGNFMPEGVKTAFQGVLLQKGENKGGWGFFMSNVAGDLNPEGGEMTLGALQQ